MRVRRTGVPTSASRLLAMAVVLVITTMGSACPLAMTRTDNIRVVNRSADTLYLYVNDGYPDTSLTNAWASSYVRPHAQGRLTLVNRRWSTYLAEKGTITLIFASVPPDPTSGRGKPERAILRTMSLSNAILDSLDWVIIFPPN
jgi:hypothetical protein